MEAAIEQERNQQAIQEYKRCRRVALIMCLPYNIKDDRYIDLLVDAISCNAQGITLTKDLLNLVTSGYESSNDMDAAVEKWKAIASIKYLEKALKCAKPVFEGVPGLFTATKERYLVTIENAKLPEGLRRVFLCEDLSMKDVDESFLLYHGVVSQEGKNACIVMSHCDKEFQSTFNENTRYTVYEQPDIYEFESEMQGCRIFLNDEIVRSKLFFNGTPSLPSEVYIPRPPKLNDLQYWALQMITGMSPEKPFVLIGTPGSGKTLTLIELLEFLYLSGKGPVLVCTSTNASCDVVTERLVERNNIPKESYCRIMSTVKNPALVSDAVKSVCFVQRHHKKNTEVFYIPKKLLGIKKCDIVISTIGMCSRLQNLGKYHFEWIIIDEAAQTSELDTGIPFSHFCGRDTKIVLAGDPSQLGKVSTSKALSKYDDEINISTITRLSRLDMYKNDESCMVTLIDNYRAEQNIMDLYNYTMYGGQLRAHEQEGHNSLHGSPILDYQEIPIRFHNIMSNEIEEESGSTFNPDEAFLVVEYVQKALEHGIEPSDIGVVAPYRAQVLFIRQLLSERNLLRNIDVNTVAAVQGTERCLVICSFVRSNGIGFLADTRRPNTMISRAKHMLILIGNGENLQMKSPYFQQLLGLIDEKGCYLEE